MTTADKAYGLVADIGGTNTRLALTKGTKVLSKSVQRFKNADHSNLTTVISAYMQQQGIKECASAGIAVAGPVMEDSAQLTNLDWKIDNQTLQHATRAKTVAILNDLVAQGHALEHLEDNTVDHIVGPAKKPDGTKLVIGIGTGFNAAPVYPMCKTHLVATAEAGHAALPLETEEDMRLASHIRQAHGFAAIEDVLSGRGLETLYAANMPQDTTSKPLAASEIIPALRAKSDPIAEKAVRSFVRFLGKVTGDLALTTLPRGGIYLVGGVARALRPWFIPYGLAESFRSKGRFSSFMEDFPVFLIENDYAALEGLAHYMNSVE